MAVFEDNNWESSADTSIAEIANFNGLDKQLEKLAEECAEVVQAALKFKRHRDATTMAHLAEEISDAQILMDQIAVLCTEIPEYSRMFRALKIKRELDRIEEQKVEGTFE